MSPRVMPAVAVACWGGVWAVGGFWAFVLALVASAACYMLGEDEDEEGGAA